MMPEIKQGFVVKIIHNGHKTYGVVAGTTKALVTIKFVAFNPELGNTSLHVYHVQPASIILPQTGGFQKSPTAVLIRQLCGVYAADPVPVTALSITDADQPETDPEITDANQDHGS